MEDPMTSGTPGGNSASLQSSSFSQRGAPSPPPGEQVHAAAGDAAQTASSLAGQAKQSFASTLDSQKGVAADLIEQFAQSVERSGEQFKGQQDWIASAIGRGAGELNTLAGSLRGKDLGELAGDVQSFAKRQPAMFIGVALVAGFAVARLGKVVAGDLSRDDLPTMPEVGHGQH